MEREEMKQIVLEAMRDEVLPVLLDLLAKSEARIDKTNKIINKFAESANEMIKTIDTYVQNQGEQFKSLEHSRDVAQKNNTELIRANIELSHMVDSLRNDQHEQMSGYKEELHSAKAKFDDLFHSYTKLAELNVTNNNNNGNEIKSIHFN
mgnify:CR=1 FL=1